MNRLPHLLPRLLAAFVALAAITPAGSWKPPGNFVILRFLPTLANRIKQRFP